MITPQTDVYLLKVPLELDSTNQLTFNNAEAQFNYFYSLPKLGFDNFTYQRKDGVLRIPELVDNLMEYNYVMYRNEAYSSKWFYAYITALNYLSDGVTAVSIKTDTWQTWQFALEYKPCLIDREHTNDDTIGANTLPEGLELGEMVVNGNTSNFGGSENYCTIVEVSMVENEGESQSLRYEWDDGSTTRNPAPRINGISRGTIPLIAGLGETPVSVNEIRELYDLAGLGDAIVNVYMLPQWLIGSYHTLTLYATRGSSSQMTVPRIPVPEGTDNSYTLGNATFNRPTSLAGFTPKNKKLLTFPYCYFNISNNAGSSIPYHYEDFSNTITFKTEGTFGASGNVKAIPIDYKNISTNENALDFSMSAPKYPICSWKSDSYTNWLTQNAVNLENQWRSTIIGGALGVGSEALGSRSMGVKPIYGAVGGAIGLASNLISVAVQQHLAKTQANMTPDQVRGNLNAGDFLWAKYRSPFTFMPMCIKPEYSRCIDEFFSQFGYKTNRVKVPNVYGRRNWNFVKTVGCYIKADIPQGDLQEIKSMFDRGITFWHNPATFADYSQNNDII